MMTSEHEESEHHDPPSPDAQAPSTPPRRLETGTPRPNQPPSTALKTAAASPSSAQCACALIRRSATTSARYMCGLPDHSSTTVKAAEGSQDGTAATGTVDRQRGYIWMDIEAPRPWSLQPES